MPLDTTIPTITNDYQLAIQIGAAATITSAFLQTDDVDNTHAQLTYTIVTTPSTGVLRKNGSAVSSFTQADIDNNRITYQETDSNVTSDYFTFHVTDSSGNSTDDTAFLFQINSIAPTVNGRNFSVVQQHH